MFGLMKKKTLKDAAIAAYLNNDTSEQCKEQEFYYRMGNANAIGYICGRCGINITEEIRRIKGEQEQEGEK